MRFDCLDLNLNICQTNSPLSATSLAETRCVGSLVNNFEILRLPMEEQIQTLDNRRKVNPNDQMSSYPTPVSPDSKNSALKNSIASGSPLKSEHGMLEKWTQRLFVFHFKMDGF